MWKTMDFAHQLMGYTGRPMKLFRTEAFVRFIPLNTIIPWPWICNTNRHNKLTKSFVVVVVLEIFILKTTFQIRKKPSLGGRPIIAHLIYTHKKIIIPLNGKKSDFRKKKCHL